MPRTDFSRRQFLRGAATTIAAPYVLGTAALGQTPASERITMGVIGLGNMGSIHLDSLLGRDDLQIVALCDVRRNFRERAARKVDEAYGGRTRSGQYRGVATYNEYEQVLARPDIDCVLVAAPDHWHAIITIAACRAGKDVYCEKPLALTIHEANEMTRAARRYGRVVQTGSQQRSDPNFRRACELVRSGYIGEVLTVHVDVGPPSVEKYLPAEPVPDGFDWDRWLGPTPWYPHNSERASGSFGGGWRFIRQYSGGMMTDWGAHHFDIAQWGLGMDGSGPVEIIPPNVADDGLLTYRYANGVTMYRGGETGILFTGTEGQVEVNRGHFRTEPESIGRVRLRPDDVHLYESPGHHQDFFNCMRTRRRPITDVAIGASSVTVCHLGCIAWWLGRPLRWDPAKKTIIGDETAARWLDRPRRAPYHLYA